MSSESNLVTTFVGLGDLIVELYLSSVIKPFLTLHEHFYSKLNAVLRLQLDQNKANVPDWFTANFITYARTWLVIPTLLLMVWGHLVLPSFLVIFVDFGDFLDGVVARFWIDVKKEQMEALASKEKPSRSSSPVDDDSYEVVSTGSPHKITSWNITHQNRTYGGFIDAVCDKAFVIPCWIFLLSTVPGSSYVRTLQYSTLWCLILAETASGSVRFRAFFTAGGVSAPLVEGLDFSTSAVKADSVGKAKQTFEMVGTALFIFPGGRYLGLLFLFLAVPLAYESVRRKVKTRVIYVNGKVDSFDHKTLKFWMQAKAMGSKLIVGIPGEKQADMVLNACAATSVDDVIAEAPEKADLMFLEKQKIDFVVLSAGQINVVTDEVIAAKRCLCIGDDGIARAVKTKEEHKKE